MDIPALLSWILLVPLLSAGAIALFFRRQGTLAVGLSLSAAGLILALSAVVLLGGWDGETLVWSTSWLTFGSFSLDISYLLSPAAAGMLAVVAFVGFWIHVFSVGYMHDDPGKARFFAGLSIFMFSMLGIVLAGNLFMIFIFWELVGFSSYMLIAHYWKQEDAAAASKKAFIVNRIGDLGLLVGIVWAYHYYGTANLADIAHQIEAGGAEKLTGMGLCLMCGFLGKSAQFPLQVWLTDAMAGPTPVSALIHAATMVAAGIYFLARIFFMLTPEVLHTILWLGAAMAFFAGFWALGQRDIKKSLAYSTLSHLGYMATAIGLGLPGLAMFHMAMHACFKATLFLCSGSVIHACHHEQDMFKMGGLRRKMPITFAAFAVATASICAVPFFAGFYSKDAIIGASLALGMGHGHGGPEYLTVFALTLGAALATTLYMGRMLWVVFFGEGNSEHARHAKESSVWMTVPLVVLGCVLSLSAAWFVMARIPGNIVTYFLEGSHHNGLHEAEHLIHEAGIHYPLMAVTVIFIIAGLGLTYLFYGRGASQDRLQTQFPLLYHVLEKHGWFDDFYNWLVRAVHDRFSKIVAFGDLFLVSLAGVQGLGGLARFSGAILRSLQTGSVHGYVYWFIAGALLFGAFALGWL